ncbi:hypothetical protein KIH41_09820 [Litoribacter ruber]|uniref:hypothetical protein n=1 Tax=Litoribacter ruber TaxID=702568 RepID=UPI001BDAEC92|nr:hypothetical protein [Litoribacter ruber]MBT0811573.1 hypothetical protein [Litoribacter ruber]
MAKQEGPIFFTGNIGKLNFYKDKDGYQVRDKGGVTAERVSSDPKFARTRENMAEFGAASTNGKYIKQILKKVEHRTKLTNLSTRLQKIMMQMKKDDPIHARGQRVVESGNWDRFLDFDLNPHTRLSSILRWPYEISTDTGKLKVSMPQFHPSHMLRFPDNATHFRLHLHRLDINLDEENDNDFIMQETPLIPVETSPIDLVLEVPMGAPAFRYSLCTLGVEFFQVNLGKAFALAKGKSNPCRIIGWIKQNKEESKVSTTQ